MFEKGEYIHYGNNGVCIVDDITHMNADGFDKEKWYYVLIPVRTQSSRIYTPVDNNKVVLRRILTREEASRLIDEIPSIEKIEIENDKKREDQYKEVMRTCDCRDWVRMVKTLYQRKQERIAAGKKVTSADERYMKAAKDQLYGELAVALGLDRDEMEDYIHERVHTTLG